MPAKRCSGRREFFFSGKGPVASLSLSRGRRGGGILYFRNKSISLCNLCGPPCLCGKCSQTEFHHRGTEDHRGFTESSARPNFNKRVLLIVATLIVLTASCSQPGNKNSSTTETREVTDEAGRRVRLPLHIDRIVSLAPNLTEIVYAVGAGDRLVGDTEYCDYPAEAKKVAKIGDTMHPSVERIIALKPQIVLVSTASQLEAFTKQLDQQEIAVYVTNPQSLYDIFRSMQTLGDLFGEHDRAATLVADLQKRAEAIEAATKQVKPVKVFYQLSGEPLYTIGRESYLTDLVRRAGGVSATADVPGAFPRFSDEAALAARPEAMILPTGGSMGNANATVASPLRNSPAILSNRIYKINDDHLSRPGPRLIEGLEEMAHALHPEAFK
jgi:iron complex transport system substrate-binding protein